MVKNAVKSQFLNSHALSVFSDVIALTETYRPDIGYVALYTHS